MRFFRHKRLDRVHEAGQRDVALLLYFTTQDEWEELV